MHANHSPGFFSVSGLQGSVSRSKTMNIFGMCKEQLPLKAKTKKKKERNPKQNKTKRKPPKE